jgi:glycerophosphoryl diester phosphodiesterase
MTRLLETFEVQGHRGARGHRPENTLVGFEYAIDLGVTSLELDTGISADGVVVVCHDPVISPMLCLDAAGQRLPVDIHQPLNQLTLAEIQAFDCGTLNPDPIAFPDQRPVPGASIPTLQQVFDLVKQTSPHIRMTIEAKSNPVVPGETPNPDAFAAALVAIVQQNDMVEQVTIQAFDWCVLQYVKQLNPSLRTAALLFHSPTTTTLRSPFLAGFDAAAYVNVANLLTATGFIDVYSPNYETLLPKSSNFLQTVDEMHRSGFPVIPWTVNDPVIMDELIGLGVDGLITDFPDRLLAILAG